MISLKDFRKSLGNLANELSDEQIIELRDQQDQFAELFFAMWQNETKNEV